MLGHNFSVSFNSHTVTETAMKGRGDSCCCVYAYCTDAGYAGIHVVTVERVAKHHLMFVDVETC